MTAPSWRPSFSDVDLTGDHAQNAMGNLVSGDLILTSNTFVRRRPTMYLGTEETEDRVRCHVAAGNHELVVKTLETDHAVVLAGPPGCGRETTAIAAIWQLRPGIRIRRFSLDDEDAEELQVKGDGYLVRAADCGRLGDCADAVRASGGYLVVIADSETARPPGYPPPITIEPPDPLHVYRRRVAVRGFNEWWHWDGAAALLQHSLPVHGRRLADLVEAIAPGTGSHAERQAEVLHSYQGWAKELRAWFAEHPEPHERALLVAAAVLAPAEETNVYTVASTLVRRLGVAMNGAGLAWCPVTGLRELLGAEDDDGRVVFRRHGYALAALRHALTDYPLARSDLLDWLATLPADEAVPDKLRVFLAGTFADLAAEHGAADLITETARTWGADGLADLAFTVLSRTCLHPRVGGKVREALYEWSRIGRTPQTLKLVTVRVCEPLGQTYPSIALTRLKHLGTYGNRQVRGEVIAAMIGLAATGHHAEVLKAALDWCAETNRENLSLAARRRRRLTGARVFLELARPVNTAGAPEPLAGDPMRYEPGWRAALDSVRASDAGEIMIDEAVHRRLDVALRHPDLRDGIARVFVQAARPSGLPVVPVPSTARYGMEPGSDDPAAATIMIGLVRSWAVADRKDPGRREIKEAIVIPLTTPWLLRLVKLGLVYLRTLFHGDHRGC